ncbi:uncharacterized protein [Apostichopus japonicus]|uniref:uncharacterized protein isoform X2 n=1 Tax=Stichopus japonicus TaxID=307972 RepID=UPI003AB4FEAB
MASAPDSSSQRKRNAIIWRRRQIPLGEAFDDWKRLKHAGGWTHNQLARHLLDVHARHCDGVCSSKSGFLAKATTSAETLSDPTTNAEPRRQPFSTPVEGDHKHKFPSDVISSLDSSEEDDSNDFTAGAYLLEEESVPPMILRVPRKRASVPATLPDVSTTSQDLSNGNNHKANTAMSLVVIPGNMNIPTEESFNSTGKIKENVVSLPGDVESVSNRLEDSEKPEETAAEDNPSKAKYVRVAIKEEPDDEEAVVIIVGTPGDGDGEDEGFEAPMQPT